MLRVAGDDHERAFESTVLVAEVDKAAGLDLPPSARDGGETFHGQALDRSVVKESNAIESGLLPPANVRSQCSDCYRNKRWTGETNEKSVLRVATDDHKRPSEITVVGAEVNEAAGHEFLRSAAVRSRRHTLLVVW